MTSHDKRRQRQRSASESISDKLSETQAQREKDLEDLWPESNSLDRNTSQYGNNAVAIRGAKLQQSDAFQHGCQSKTAVETSGAKSNNSNNEFRFEDKNAAAITGAKSLIKDPTSQDKNAVAITGAKSLTSDSYRSCCQSCRKERQLTPPPPLPLELHTLHSCNTLSKPKHPSLLPKSRSLVLPMRPSLTELRPQQRESCNIDKVQGYGKQPETYLQHLNNQQKSDIEDKFTVNSLQDQFLGGLTRNKCNNSSNTDLYSSGNGCHGDQVESAGIWASSSVGCHGSSCCLNVVQDVLNRIPITPPCKSQQLSSVLDLRTSSCNSPALSGPTLPLDFTPCFTQYVFTPYSVPRYGRMRIKRHSSALMGNLPCWKQRHHHDDNDYNVKHVSFIQIQFWFLLISIFLSSHWSDSSTWGQCCVFILDTMLKRNQMSNNYVIVYWK